MTSPETDRLLADVWPIVATFLVALVLTVPGVAIRYQYGRGYLWLSWLPIAFVLLVLWEMFPLHRGLPSFAFPQFGLAIAAAASIIELFSWLKLPRPIAAATAIVICTFLLYENIGWS